MINYKIIDLLHSIHPASVLEGRMYVLSFTFIINVLFLAIHMIHVQVCNLFYFIFCYHNHDNGWTDNQFMTLVQFNSISILYF